MDKREIGGYGVVANVQSDRALRTGAKVWVLGCNGDASCPQVRGLSKGGRTITKYTHYKRLASFRAAWIPDHQLPHVWATWMFTERADAEKCAEILGRMWDGVRYFNRDGSLLLRDGITGGEAFKREQRGAQRATGR